MKISVVVCTYNRDRYILKCLLSLKNQSFDKADYEVIIVNNKSTDNTESYCLNFIANNRDVLIKYLVEENQGLSYSRNRGIKESSGHVICFIDDDAFAEPDFLNSIDKFFQSHPKAVAIGGRIIPFFESSIPAWLSPYLLPLFAALDLGNKIKRFSSRKFPIGANMSFRREIFEKVGLFDSELGRKGEGLTGGEEKDIIYKIRAAKGEIFYLPSAEVKHIIPAERLTEDYIRRQAIGVGISERIRISRLGSKSYWGKFAEEVFKSGATLVLFFFYLIRLSFPKGWMLLRFRCWVLKGLFTGKSNDVSRIKALF
jgi:glucosyl-dolichyl phosphate glucuronosyltransferase